MFAIMSIMDKKSKFDDLMKRLQFILPSCLIYNGMSGFQDYGVLGYHVKSKIIDTWKKSFIDNLSTFIVETPNILPANVLSSSGHMDRFFDYLVVDSKEQPCVVDSKMCRADHLCKRWFRDNKMFELYDSVDTMSQSDLESYINKYNMLNLNEKLKVIPMGLMYNMNGDLFMRPELAQGIFINFDYYKKFSKQECNFGVAQIGKSYRREISPQPYLRLREFTQAELEYWVDPNNKTHKDYNKYKHIVIPLLSIQMQMNKISSYTAMSIENAVKTSIIGSEILGYYLGKINEFVKNIGINNYRFRQHMPNEMAHYALECWDLEVYIDDDWVECIGCADRGSYDLLAHKCSKSERVVISSEKKTTWITKPNGKNIAKKYGNKTHNITTYLNNLSNQELELYENKLNNDTTFNVCIDNIIYKIDNEMLTIDKKIEETKTESYICHTIEPSFGIDRLLYAILYNNFEVVEKQKNNSEDVETRCLLKLPKIFSFYTCSLFVLSKKPELVQYRDMILTDLRSMHINVYIDDSTTTLGKQYMRSDEMGIMHSVVIDFDTLTTNTVSIRNRDTQEKTRMNIHKFMDFIKIENVS